MLRYFENGEDVPFAVEYPDGSTDAELGWGIGALCDELGTRVFKIMPDKSLKRASASRADVWLERARPISEAFAYELAKIV